MAQPIWNTPAGSIGTYPSSVIMEKTLSATPISPAVSITYTIISGNLPNGLSMNEDGVIFGVPGPVFENTSSTFVVRATDNLQNIKDRTFNLTITGLQAPYFTTPSGSLIVTNDSVWTEFPVQYNNPIETNEVVVKLIQGELPPGLEINPYGMIRGYPEPPYITIQVEAINTSALATNNNEIVCFSTSGLTVGRPVVFSGTVFGGVVEGQTYYIHSIINETNFKIASIVGGPSINLTNDVGYMSVYLPSISVGQPYVRTYSFTLKLESQLGNDIKTYNITVKNQNAPASLGGPSLPYNSRTPTIYNTRPFTYNITENSVDYGYYVLPPNSKGETYNPNDFAYIGKITSDNFFSFKLLGHDFDGNELEYLYVDMPLGLVGDAKTGWITGTPIIANDSITEFSFGVAAYKKANPTITTPVYYYIFKLRNGIEGEVTWLTNNNLGTIYNGTPSTVKVEAISDVPLEYEIVSGELPPNLTLLSSGELAGTVAYQPTNTFLGPDESTVFTFTIKAFSPQFPIVASEQTFTITVFQEFNQPTDTLYIKCSPSVADRNLLASLLNNEELIPNEYLYRLDDPNFGKATSVIYEHAYGINASSFDEYIAAVTKNHYWRNITLGEIKTAVARDDQGNIIYEVVYSEVIDNLINPQGVSVAEDIFWPRFIPLGEGDWYTTLTNVYASYIGSNETTNYYTSLTPGYARILYPNSLPNMRNRVAQTLGQEFNSNVLPKWMTSQQRNGSTTGFVPAWVICYTKPGFSEIVKNNIQTNWVDVVGNVNTLNTINFRIDRFTVDKSITYNYDKNLSPPTWTSLPSATPEPNPKDSNDFYVLFPRKTILPDEPQYPR